MAQWTEHGALGKRKVVRQLASHSRAHKMRDNLGDCRDGDDFGEHRMRTHRRKLYSAVKTVKRTGEKPEVKGNICERHTRPKTVIQSIQRTQQ